MMFHTWILILMLSGGPVAIPGWQTEALCESGYNQFETQFGSLNYHICLDQPYFKD